MGGDLVAMVRRPMPVGCHVVEGSTPVVAFGDWRRAQVATLGINPSAKEFVVGGRLLVGPRRRLATLESLGAESTSVLTDAQVAQVVADCAAYFHRNPYRAWFDPLDDILHRALGVSYFDDTACHLDLVQWATDPVWGKIPNAAVRRVLLDDGAEHLGAQLRGGAVRTVVVNGAAVWDQLGATGLADWEEVGELTFGNRGRSARLRVGTGCGVRFVGWTLNVQSSHGVTAAAREELAGWLGTVVAASTPVVTVSGRATNDLPGDQDTGLGVAEIYLAPTTIHTKAALAELLQRWFDTSTAATIGDLGRFAGRPLVRLVLGDGQVVTLNADTRRDAVRRYLNEVTAHGPEAPWQVRRNRRGKINRIEFGSSRVSHGGLVLLPAPGRRP